MTTIGERLAALEAGVATAKAALGRYTRVPEIRWGTITGADPLWVTLDGDSAAQIVTRSAEAVCLNDRVLVQVQGHDRWVLSVAASAAPVAYANSWSDYGAPYGPVQVARHGALAVLSGACRSAGAAYQTSGIRIFTVPEGFRPSVRRRLHCMIPGYSTSPADLFLEPSGAMCLSSTYGAAAITFAGFDGVTWDAT